MAEHFGGEIAKSQAAVKQLGRFRFQHRAVFVECAEAVRQLEQITSQLVGPIIGQDQIDRFGKLQRREC